ncbi:MAG: transposase family protein [Acidobacteriota bacterium]
MSVSFLPDPSRLKLNKIISNHESITIDVESIACAALCPLCQQPSRKVHSYYSRTLADLPWSGFAVSLLIHTRKFYCSTLDCKRKIFTERLPEVARSYARKTVRLNETLTLIGYVVGGEAESCLALQIGMSVSPDTLINRIR